MKKNTGCGKGHHGCPPMPATDVAKSRSTGCEVDPLYTYDFEKTRVLKELELKIPTEADIKLPSYATDIKEIRKNVHLTQCKAVQEVYNPYQVTLFVEGFVHKNIQYAESSNGYIRDYSINVPFKCFHVVDLKHDASFPYPSSKNSGAFELRELAKSGKEADRCNFGSQTWEINNEPIHCKLLYSVVDQWDMAHNFDNWGRFNKFTEKMRVTLALKLTQKQQFSDPRPYSPAESDLDSADAEETEESNLDTVEKKIQRLTRRSR